MRSTGEAGRRASGAAPAPAGDGAAVILRALRLAAVSGCGAAVACAFAGALGPVKGAAAAQVFRVLLQGLALGRRRRLRTGAPGRPWLSPDERALLQLVEAARRGDDGQLDRTAEWLVRPQARRVVVQAASLLARLTAGEDDGCSVPAQARQRPLSARIASGAS